MSLVSTTGSAGSAGYESSLLERGSVMARRLVPLLGVVALAVVAGLALNHSGIAEEVAHLDEADRWSQHYDPDTVSAVAPAPDGGVWAGTTAAGLVRWHPDGSYQRHLTGRLAGHVVQDVVAAADGTVWATASSFGEDPSGRLLRFDGDEWRVEPILGGEADDALLHSLAADEDAAWVATRQGVARFDGDEWTTRTIGDDGSPLRARAVVTDGDGVVWAAVADERRRVVRLDDERSSTAWPVERQRDEGRPLTNEAPLAVGADGSVWIATMEHAEGDAVHVQPWRLTDGEWVAAAPGFEAPYGQLRAFAVDDDGRPWIAMGLLFDAQGRKSLWHFDGQRWQRSGPSDGLPHTMMSSVAIGEDGVVWTGTVEGVGRFADGEWTRYATGEGPGGNFHTGLASGEEGTVWTAGAFGVSRFDGQGWTSWGADDGLAVTAGPVDHVAVGPDGGAWAATADEVFRFDGQQWISLSVDRELGDNDVTSLAVGPDATVWVGAYRRVSRFDGEQWTTWTADDDGLPHGEVRSLAVGDDVWAASPGGVVRFDGDGWEQFTVEDGLPTSTVHAVALGTGPRVWAGTEEGLARFDGQRWAHADSDDAQLTFEGDPPAVHEPVQVLATGDDGTVWAVAGDPPLQETLSAFDGRQWHTTSLDVHRVRALTVDEDAAWVASPDGLARFDRGGE